MMQEARALSGGTVAWRAVLDLAQWLKPRTWAGAAGVRAKADERPNDAWIEVTIAVFALVSLLAAQTLLVASIDGASYRGVDGGMVQSVVLTALTFGDFFNITNINPLQGIGSQILPKNVWANPGFWPFALFHRELAVEISTVVALGCFAVACYVMARCFDVPLVPSVLAAQLCLLLFAPAVYFYGTPSNCSATPPDAVTYAPYLLALGLLARIEQGPRQFVLMTAGITACLLYSIYCDPAFTMIPAVSWSVAFATVALFAPQLRIVAMRVSALACTFAVLIVSGAAVYLYTFSQFSARVQYAHVVDRVRGLELVTSFSFTSPFYHFYVAFATGLLIGLVLGRGRARTLIVAAILSFVFYVGYSIVYLLLVDAPWLLPIPFYVEHSLFALFATGAAAGWWTLLQPLVRVGSGVGWWLSTVDVQRTRSGGAAHEGSDFRTLREAQRRNTRWRPRLAAGLALGLGLAAAAVIPAKAALFAVRDARHHAETFYWPWAYHPELVQLLSEQVGLTIGGPFRGYVNVLTGSDDGTIDDLHSRGVPTVNEYSQTASAQSLYFLYKMTKRHTPGLLNRFEFFWRNGTYSPNFWALSQLLGVRYTAERWRLPEGYNPGFPLVTMPYHRPANPNADEPGLWYVYELPRPNVGDYSPTEVIVAGSGEDITAAMHRPGFDFTRQVVLSAAIETPLVPARNLRLSVIRNGLHLSGHSEATSLVVLPQQFSHCLRAKDRNVRLVRADLLLTGVVFSGDLDVDITFDYGIVSPWCRLADLADVRALDLKIDLRRAHLTGGRLFPTWDDALVRLKAAGRRIGFLMQ